MSDSDSLNRKVVTDLQDLMGDAYLTVYEAFSRSSQNNMAGLEAAVINKNIRDIEEITHTLKGSAANIGALQLSKLSKVILDDARNGRTADNEMNLRNLKVEYASVSIAIKALLAK